MIAVIAFGLGRLTAHRDSIVHVYVIAEFESRTRNAQVEALETYLEAISDDIRSELHFSTPSNIQVSTQQLLAHLAASANIPAEAPLFITIDSPTSRSKKQLRLAFDMDKNLTGIKRHHALSAVVPVLTLSSDANAESCDQLVDDIIYAHDNFAGIAFIINGNGIKLLYACARTS